MQRIAIDMDEVVADTMTRYLAIYNADFGLSLTREHFNGRRVMEVTKHRLRTEPRNILARHAQRSMERRNALVTKKHHLQTQLVPLSVRIS